MKRYALFSLACATAFAAGCSNGSGSSPLLSAKTSAAPYVTPASGQKPSVPLPVSVSASQRLHPLPAWMAKRDPGAVRAPSQLSRRYSLPQLHELYGQLIRTQDMERIRVHSQFERMPASDNLDVLSQRSLDEGNKIKAAQDHVYDIFRHDHHLTEDQMSVLFQVATDNHWDSASQ